MKENEEGMEQKERENHFWRLRNFIIGQSLKYSEKGFIQRERERERERPLRLALEGGFARPGYCCTIKRKLPHYYNTNELGYTVKRPSFTSHVEATPFRPVPPSTRGLHVEASQV